MPHHTIRIVDQTVKHRALHADLEDICHAVKLGLREFADDHGLSHSIDVTHYHLSSRVPPIVGPFDYIINLRDTLDVEDALGYHWRNPDGTPVAEIGVGVILGTPGGSWRAGVNSIAMVIDHEAKETELDRSAARFVFDMNSRAWAEEACDAVQSNVIEGVRGVSLSNYVLPNYFIPGAPGPYDKLGVLKAPLSIAPGGYAILADLSNERNTYGTRDLEDFERAYRSIVGGVSFEPSEVLSFAPDPRGRGAIVVSGTLPEWAHEHKSRSSARTMRRLSELQ